MEQILINFVTVNRQGKLGQKSAWGRWDARAPYVARRCLDAIEGSLHLWRSCKPHRPPQRLLVPKDAQCTGRWSVLAESRRLCRHECKWSILYQCASSSSQHGSDLLQQQDIYLRWSRWPQLCPYRLRRYILLRPGDSHVAWVWACLAGAAASCGPWWQFHLRCRQ